LTGLTGSYKKTCFPEEFMYKYDDYDHQMLQDRINQFREQTRRYIAGELTEEQFLPLRLQNGPACMLALKPFTEDHGWSILFS